MKYQQQQSTESTPIATDATEQKYSLHLAKSEEGGSQNISFHGCLPIPSLHPSARRAIRPGFCANNSQQAGRKALLNEIIC